MSLFLLRHWCVHTAVGVVAAVAVVGASHLDGDAVVVVAVVVLPLLPLPLLPLSPSSCSMLAAVLQVLLLPLVLVAVGRKEEGGVARAGAANGSNAHIKLKRMAYFNNRAEENQH